MIREAAVADASVVIPWLQSASEPFERECLRLSMDFQNGILQLMAPSLLFYEAANFISRQKRVSTHTEMAFERFLRLDFSIYQLEADEFQTVKTIARRYDLSAYDASYYHVAETMGVPLWTADEKLLKAWGTRPGGHIKNYRSP